MPVKGEYRYMVGNANLASKLGMASENIFLKQNGDVVEIVDGKHTDKNEHCEKHLFRQAECFAFHNEHTFLFLEVKL